MTLSDVYINEKQDFVAVFKCIGNSERFIILPKEEAAKLADNIKELL